MYYGSIVVFSSVLYIIVLVYGTTTTCIDNVW